jgi:putative ABC transport system permease protein
LKRDATALRLIECIARGLLGLSGRNIPPAGRDEILASIAAACADHATRRGRAALVRVAIAELLDLALLPVRSRLAPVDRISNGPHRTPVVFHRGPLMFIDDLRRATRRLRSNVSSIALTAAMLAVAIGITAAMFTVLDALVLHPVPFRDAARLTTVVVTRGESYLQTIPRPLFRALRTSGAFAAVEGAIQSPVTLDTGHELVTQAGARITPGMLAMLGVKPILGRGFVEGEGRAGTEDRILLSEGLWQKLFNRDPDVIGRRIRVSGVSTEIVGVLPADFRFPYARAVAWRPIDFDGSSELERMQPMTYARLAPELPAADALRTATAAGRATGVMPEGSQFLFRPIAAGMVDPYSRRSISVLAVAVILVFLVLCANAMNLMLTRFSERQREFGMCSALGASRGRLLREALLETVLLGAAAAMIGLLLANTLIQLVTHYMPEAFLTRTLTPVALNSRALLVTSSLAFLAAAIAGVVPAWMATRVDALESLRLAGRAGTEVPTRRRLAKGLLIAEVALATTLLAGAGLLVRTFVNLTNADRGLNSEGVITGWVSLPSFSFKDRASRLTFAGELEGRLRGLPGVQAASLSGGVPPTHGSIYFGAVQTDAQGATPIEAGEIMVYSVSPQFFELFDIKLLAGRTFSAVSSPDDLILGERLARLLWPTGDAVGRSFQIEGHKTWYRVVGVVREIRNPLLDPRQDSMEIYHPLVVDRNGSAEASTFGSGNVFLALRCGETCPAIPSIAETIRSVSSQVVIAALGPMDEEYREALARPRAAAALGTVFGVVALLAAAGGLFGVLSAAVARRKREFGIRVALGLSPALLGRLVVVDALKLAAAGVGAGLLGAWMLGRGLAALTYEVSAADPQSLAGVCAALTLAIVVASWRPALRASRVDPVALLRED